MRTFSLMALLASALVPVVAAADVTVTVSGGDDQASRAAVPVSIPIDLEQSFGRDVDPQQLQLIDLSGQDGATAEPLRVQFVPEEPGKLRGRLWWFSPAALDETRRFALVRGSPTSADSLIARYDRQSQAVDIIDDGVPVLRYNHGDVPVPSGIDPEYARGDYISPLFGLRGETLTDDYPADHPHHRGVSWSWPVVRWGDQVRDIWAVRGVRARPVTLRRLVAGPIFAAVDAESVWKWGDEEAILKEEVLIRAFRRFGEGRIVDVEVRLTALADEVAIGGRPEAGYGGFGLRAAPAEQQKITLRGNGSPAGPVWLDYSATFPGGKEWSGVSIFEHVDNPGYPSPLHEYAHCNYAMPAFPGEREVRLPQDQPLVLKHRLRIHADPADEARCDAIWAAYANPPQATVDDD